MSNIISKINLNDTDNYIASSAYGICTTAANQSNKTVSLQSGSNFTLINGITVHIKFNNTNTAGNPTLNINNTGTKNILNPGGNGDIQWPANSVLSLTYYDNNYYINGFFKEGSGGGESGLTISPATNVYNVSTTSSSIGSINKYAREDHVHQLNVATGQENGYVQIGTSQVQVKGIAAAAFRDITGVVNANNENKVPTASAIINYVTNQIPLVPILSTNISADSTSNTKATTPKAVVDYIDLAISGLTPGGGESGSNIELSNDIASLSSNRFKATTPYAVSTYVQNLIAEALEDFDPGESGSSTPAFAHISSSGTSSQISADSNTDGDLFNINAGALTSVTLTPNTKTVTIGSTLTSESAVQNGTTLSLVTTGEKYMWNNVSQATGGINFALAESPAYTDNPIIFPSLVHDLILLADEAEGPHNYNYYLSEYSNGNLSFGDPSSENQ